MLSKKINIYFGGGYIMVDIISPIIAFGFGGSLAKTIVDLMTLRQNRVVAEQTNYQQITLAQMEHDFQIRLQEAQHQHELLLERIRSHEAGIPIKVVEANNNFPRHIRVEANDNFPEYLNTEAELLCSKGFDAVFDPVNDGYGLAIFIKEALVLCFWLPPAYPHQAPEVFVIESAEIDQIQFEGDAWQPERNILEVVEAVSTGY
jgi:hypothetical protein